MRTPTRAVLTALAAALVAAASLAGMVPALKRFGELPVVAAAVLLALIVALGWPVLLGLPNKLGSGVVIAIGGSGAVLAVTGTKGEPVLRVLPIVIGLSVLFAFVNELARHDGRVRLVESVSGTISGLLVACASAGWVASGRTPGGSALVVSGAVALAVAAFVSAMPLVGWRGVVLTVGGGVLGSAAVETTMRELNLAAGLVLGVATGLLIAALHVLFNRLPALRRRLAALAVIVLPVAVSGIMVYVVGRVLVA